MSNKRISELTTSSVPIKSTDYLEVSVYNGSTYDSKKVSSDYLKPYKVYTALLTQSGTSAPTATVLENTIGSIVWARSASGDYNGTLTGAFTASKTFVSLTLNYAGTSVTGYGVRSNDNVVLVQTIDATNTGVDNKLNVASLEIRVYQ